MAPKGTYLLLAIGVALLSGGFGLAFLIGNYLQPAPILGQLAVFLMIGFGLIALKMAVHGVLAGLGDAKRHRRRKQ